MHLHRAPVLDELVQLHHAQMVHAVVAARGGCRAERVQHDVLCAAIQFRRIFSLGAGYAYVERGGLGTYPGALAQPIPHGGRVFWGG